MDTTKEWLWYIESNAIRQLYNIKGYTTENKNKKEDKEDDSKLSE